MGRSNIRRKPGDLLNPKFINAFGGKANDIMYRIVFIFIVFISLTKSYAQDFSQRHLVLDTVRIEGLTDKKILQTYQIIDLADSLSETSSLPDLLNKKTAVFIKEYGKGMIAGLSLRGTGTAHSQVVWNGISINSLLTGQTDLNTFLPTGFNRIYLKKGGSTVSFGSGAVGGVLLFDDKINFIKAFHLQNQIKLASFKTFSNSFNLIKSSDKFYTKANLSFLKSQNDYPYVGYEITNENGAYQGLDFSFISGYKINSKNKLYFKTKNTTWNRETSRTLYMPQNARLKTANRYFLTGWQLQNSHFSNHFDIAYIYENFRYFFDKNKSKYDLSKSQSYILKNLSVWQFSSHKKIIFGQEVSRQTAKGAHINRHIRNNLALFAIWSQKLKKWDYQLKIRQDFNQKQNIPLTGAVELAYRFKPHHKFRINASHNYRLPTFNDLFWTPGGNPQLNPEDSFSYETGYDFGQKKWQFHLTLFYIDSHNLIKWVPVHNNFWQPQNFENVSYKGIELSSNQNIKLSENWQFNNHFNLNFQQAQNVKTKKILPFTPQWIGQNSLDISYKKLKLNYQYRYQGKIFTTTSNTKFLPAYQLHNVSLNFQINRHFKTRININNLLNTYYENIPSRPLPGRFYEFILNFKL